MGQGHVHKPVVLDVVAFDAVLQLLREDGYVLQGPTVRDGAIVLAEITSVHDLPHGTGDVQSPGHYRLRRRGDDALFGFAVSPHSPKRELLAPRVPLVTLRKRGRELSVDPVTPTVRRVAFIGVRGCELAAIDVQDRVLMRGSYVDADYCARREAIFTFAVHCGAPAATCFCTSMGTGPRAERDFDLAATELLEPEHCFIVEIGSDRGAALLARLRTRVASEEQLRAASEVTDAAARHIARRIDTDELPGLLRANLEHPRWDAVAERCLGCANCTMVCPTCFCTTTEDVTDLSGELATRTRRWDSCFTADFAYVAGGSARPTLRARYRQWLTHKLGTWHEQFGTSGCVGCGRCITFCPVGIDITEEVSAIAATDQRADSSDHHEGPWKT